MSVAWLSPAAALACVGAGAHAWAADSSSAGTNTGTATKTAAWSNWYAQYPYGFSNEAVWSMTNGNSSHSIEGGIYTGYGTDVAWTNVMAPYTTQNNGYYEHDHTGDAIPAGQVIWMSVQPSINGNNASVTVYSHQYSIGPYGIPTPRLNYFQGEVVSNCGVFGSSWLGGGTGETFTLYYQPAANYPGGWSTWGFQNPGSIGSPYWLSASGAYTFSNGGK
jgi:hypothetical protein